MRFIALRFFTFQMGRFASPIVLVEESLNETKILDLSRAVGSESGRSPRESTEREVAKLAKLKEKQYRC
jgi:hypothetical protein